MAIKKINIKPFKISSSQINPKKIKTTSMVYCGPLNIAGLPIIVKKKRPKIMKARKK